MNEVKTKTHSGMRGATVCVARKVILTAALGAFVAAARADVYSNALFWARGIGVDYNSNGAIGYKEVSDSLNRLTTYGEAYDSKSDTKGSAFASPYINPLKPPFIFPKIPGNGLFERSSKVFSLKALSV